MKKRQTRAWSLPQGRLPGGRAGADRFDAEIASLNGLVRQYLDSRPHRGKPLTATELRKKLARRPLNVRQADQAVLAAILCGLVGVAENGSLHDSRTLFADDQDPKFERVRLRTELMAEELVQLVVDADKDRELATHLARLLNRRLRALPRLLLKWGHFAAEAKVREGERLEVKGV